MRFFRRHWPVLFAGLACVWTAGLLLVFFFGERFWLLDLPTFGWPYLTAATVMLTAIALLLRRMGIILPLAIALSIATIRILDIPDAPPAPVCSLRVISANLFVQNERGPEAFVGFLRAEKPDILVTQETRPEWEAAIRDAGLFAHESSRDLRDRDDMKVFSRLPIVDERVLGIHRPGKRDRFPIRFALQDGANPIILYAVHPDTPRSPRQWQARNRYLETVATAVAADEAAKPSIVAGDWNTPTHSSFFRDFLNRSHLASASAGAFLSVTRFKLNLAPSLYAGSTIDHIAMSAQFGVLDRRLGPDYGSNHLPVIADLGYLTASSGSIVSQSDRCGRH